MDEIAEKLQRLRAALELRGLNAALLGRTDNCAWASGGARCFVNTATDFGSAALLITPDHQYVLTSNIEAPRLAAEEPLVAGGFEILSGPWYEPTAGIPYPAAGLGQLHDLRLGADVPYAGAEDIAGLLHDLRVELMPIEGERLRALGQACAAAMSAAIRRVQPGMTEYEIAGVLGNETLARGVLPIVNLIATDERIFRFRHPLPAGKVLDRYAMLVLCGRQNGLVCSITRLVHFGPLSEELQRKSAACALVDATFIANTRPGRRVSDIFAAAVAAYEGAGFAGEWQLHHQGGAAGYQPREYVGTPVSKEIVRQGQVFAWNPSITGVKSEDTILVGENGNEILTEIPGWPAISVSVNGATWQRPAILVR